MVQKVSKASKVRQKSERSKKSEVTLGIGRLAARSCALEHLIRYVSRIH